MAMHRSIADSLEHEIAARVPEVPDGVGPSRDEIAAVVAAIVRRFRPEQVVLYGSRAYGVPTAESDVDLMVVMDVQDRLRDHVQAVRAAVREAASPPPPWISWDVKVGTPERIRLGLEEGDFFIEEVMLQGITLFGEGGVVRSDGGTGERADREGVSHPKQAVLDWVRLAEADHRSAVSLRALPDAPVGVVCFHAQQCAEKYLRALLQDRSVECRRTHDLNELATSAAGAIPALGLLGEDLEPLNAYAVGIRYPDALETDLTVSDADDALRVAGKVRAVVRTAIGLDDASV